MGPNFIEPLKSQGIRYVEDGAIVIGVKYIAKPQTRSRSGEAYQRIITAFKENGIEMVGRGVVVQVEGHEALGPVAGSGRCRGGGATRPWLASGWRRWRAPLRRLR